MGEGRSLAETPTWSVATVTTAMVAVCFLVERSIYRFGKVKLLFLSLSLHPPRREEDKNVSFHPQTHSFRVLERGSG